MRVETKDNGQDIVIGIERTVKSLLWVTSGYKVIIAESEVAGNKIKEA